MISYRDALDESIAQFHENSCERVTLDTGRAESRRVIWQRSGPTQTDADRPRWFRIPIRYGFRSGSITPENAHAFHTADDCPRG